MLPRAAADRRGLAGERGGQPLPQDADRQLHHPVPFAGRAELRAAAARAAHHGLHLLPGRAVDLRLQPHHGQRHAGHHAQHPRGPVPPHGKPAHPLLRHAFPRRHHVHLHQRHRHPAPDDQPEPAAARLLRHHGGERLRLDDRAEHSADDRDAFDGGDHDPRDGLRHGQVGPLLRRPAEEPRRGERLHRGDDGGPEGRQGLLPRGREHRAV